MAQYGDGSSYWDERYRKDPDSFDWYQGYATLRNSMNETIRKDARILMAGCGNSRLSEDMNEDGYTDILNIDVSTVAIGLMRERHPNMHFEVMDVRKLEYPDEHLDAIVDKGTLDTLLCTEAAAVDAKTALMEAARCLKPQGVYFMVSYGAPETRLPYLEDEDLSWAVTVHKIEKPEAATGKGKPGFHFLYVCHKGGTAEEG